MGTAERQYSVSLPRHRRRTGPKPSEKRSTPTPIQRATRKWPSSWTRIKMPMTTTKDRTVVTRALPPPSPGAGRRHRLQAEDLVRHPPRLAVDGHALLDARELPRRNPIESLGDLGEAEASVQEGRDGDLIGGVEHHGGRAAPGQRLAREPQAGKLLRVGLVEGELPHRRQVQGGRRAGPALGERA